MENKNYVIYHKNAQAYFVETDSIEDTGFHSVSKENATKFDLTTANKKAFFFGHNVEIIHVD